MEKRFKTEKPKKQGLNKLIPVIGVGVIVVGVCGIIGVKGDNNESSMTVSEFLEDYNELSQSGFEDSGITGRDEIQVEDLIAIDRQNPIFEEYGDCEVSGCYYQYDGMYSSPGLIQIWYDENDIVQAVYFTMSIEYIMGNDTLQTVILDSMISAYDPDLSSDEIYEIKSQFSMENQLVGRTFMDDAEYYGYDGKIYYADADDSYVNFQIFSTDRLDI